MTEQEYLIAWAIYGVAALLLLVVCFKASGWLWRPLREPIRLIVAVLLLTPTMADAEHGLYAPALAVTVLDLVFKVGNSAWSAVADLAVAGSLALVPYLIYVIGRWLYWRSRPRPVPVTDPDTSVPPTAKQDMSDQVNNRTQVSPDSPDRMGRRERVEPRL